MKMILVCLSFYLILNSIFVLGTLNVQQHQSNIFHPHSHLQGLTYQQQAHSHNNTIIHGQVSAINNKSNLVNQSRFQRGKYQRQNTIIPRRPTNPLIHNREVHPRFRPWFQTRGNNRTQISFTALHSKNISSILNNNMPLMALHQADTKTIGNTPKSSSLLRLFTPKPQVRDRISFADSYFQRQLRAFLGHQHEKFPAPTRSHIKIGLR